MSRTRLLAFCAAFLALALTWATARADGIAVVRLDPVVNEVQAGQVFTVRIYVENVENLYGADARLQFNPSVVQAEDQDPFAPGVQIRPLSTFMNPGFVIKKVAFNDTIVPPGECPRCRVWYAATQLNPAPPVSGSGPLAEVTFRAIKSGNPGLSVVFSQLADRNGMTIPSYPGTAKYLFLPLMMR